MKLKRVVLIVFITLGFILGFVGMSRLERIRWPKGSHGFAVDAVVTWVDPDDPVWQKARRFKKASKRGTVAHRFENVNELYYCLRGITTYLPWIRTIFLVTMKPQKPLFLDEFPKVRLIHHVDFFKTKKNLPTFNSMAIETQLHRIPGLAEQFIYFNDDSFIGKPLSKKFFYTSNGVPKMYIRNTLNPYVTTTYDVLHTYGVETRYGAPLHQAVPLKKSFFTAVWKRFGRELRATARSRFRRRNNIVIVGLIYQVCGCPHAPLPASEELYIRFTDPSETAREKLAAYSAVATPPALICLNNIVKNNKDHIKMWKTFTEVYKRHLRMTKS